MRRSWSPAGWWFGNGWKRIDAGDAPFSRWEFPEASLGHLRGYCLSCAMLFLPSERTFKVLQEVFRIHEADQP